MLYHPALTILIAQSDARLESFSGGFRRNRDQFDSSDLVFVIAGLAVAFALLWLMARSSERRANSNSSIGLFWTLAKAHNIPWADRWLLWRIARSKGVVEPALLFLDPRLTSPQLMGQLAPQALLRLKAFRRTVFFGIDRVGDDTKEPLADQQPPLSRQKKEVDIPPLPSEPAFPLAPTGELADVLGAIRAFSLQEHLVPKREPPEDPAPASPDQSPSLTAEFPAAKAPVLDLYPWLSNDWEITNTDQRRQ